MASISLLKFKKNKTILKALSYAFSGFSIIYIGYILVVFLKLSTKNDRNLSL